MEKNGQETPWLLFLNEVIYNILYIYILPAELYENNVVLGLD